MRNQVETRAGAAHSEPMRATLPRRAGSRPSSQSTLSRQYIDAVGHVLIGLVTRPYAVGSPMTFTLLGHTFTLTMRRNGTMTVTPSKGTGK